MIAYLHAARVLGQFLGVFDSTAGRHGKAGRPQPTKTDLDTMEPVFKAPPVGRIAGDSLPAD